MFISPSSAREKRIDTIRDALAQLIRNHTGREVESSTIKTTGPSNDPWEFVAASQFPRVRLATLTASDALKIKSALENNEVSVIWKGTMVVENARLFHENLELKALLAAKDAEIKQLREQLQGAKSELFIARGILRTVKQCVATIPLAEQETSQDHQS